MVYSLILEDFQVWLCVGERQRVRIDFQLVDGNYVIWMVAMRLGLGGIEKQRNNKPPTTKSTNQQTNATAPESSHPIRAKELSGAKTTGG